MSLDSTNKQKSFNMPSLAASYLDLSSLSKLTQVNKAVNRECGLKIALDCIHQQPAKGPMGDSWKHYCLERLKAEPELLEQLDIQISAPRMAKIFREYGILALREPKEVSQLLLFCGNSPLESSAMKLVYSPKERRHHAHTESLTIDCDALMNPSIVASWPSPEVQKYLINNYPGFQSMEGESMPFTRTIDDGQDELDSALAIMQTLLADGGQCTTDINISLSPKSIIEKSARRFSLKVAFNGKPRGPRGNVSEIATFTKIKEVPQTTEQPFQITGEKV